MGAFLSHYTTQVYNEIELISAAKRHLTVVVGCRRPRFFPTAQNNSRIMIREGCYWTISRIIPCMHDKVYNAGAGDYQLQSTYGTKVFLDLDLPETRMLLQRDQEHIQIRILDAEEADEMLISTLAELLQADVADQNEIYKCHRTITEVRTEVDWRYQSCTSCPAGIDEDGKCRQCNEPIPYPKQRLITTIADETAYTTLVIFGREAEKIIGRPIEALLTLYEKVHTTNNIYQLCEEIFTVLTQQESKHQEGGKEKVFNILQHCVGREYTMKVKIGITKYNSERELKCQKVLPPTKDPPTPPTVERKDKNPKEQPNQDNLEKHPATESDPPVNTPAKNEKRKIDKGFEAAAKEASVAKETIEKKRSKVENTK